MFALTHFHVTKSLWKKFGYPCCRPTSMLKINKLINILFLKDYSCLLAFNYKSVTIFVKVM